jgi:5,10-methylenetetrahydromethanopterin reductase
MKNRAGTDLAPVADDLSAWIIAGAVVSESQDNEFQRHQLLDVAAVIPDAHMTESSAIGSVGECVASLQRFIDAGAHEIATYGSTPHQNPP